MGNWYLDNLPKIVQLTKEIIPTDYILYCTDTEKFLFMDESTYSSAAHMKPGTLLAKDSITMKCIEARKRMEVEIDAKLYGVDLKFVCTPVFDDDDPSKIAGTVGCMVRRNNAHALRNIADTYNKGMHEISAASQENAVSAGEINASEKVLYQEIISVQEKTRSIVEILSYIRSIADETKMLGLNAAIEAARAGEFGKGFGVVATEIRKLSEMSKETTKRIADLAQKIDSNVESVIRSSKATLMATQEQAAAGEEIAASIQELTSMIEELRNIAYSI